ncbi:MAG: MarR family winged helix-turn-helix transcriptional regulator [Actinomycetota bacterium]
MTETDNRETEVTLERRLGQRLHAFSNLVSATFYQRTEVPFGVSLPEWRVLQEAMVRPGTSQGEVAETHGLNVMVVSRAVSGLVRKGLIEVAPDPDDRRRRLLHVTETGAALGQDIAGRAAVMYDHIFSALSRAEREQLDELMDRVNAVLRAADFPDPPPGSRPWSELIAGASPDRS